MSILDEIWPEIEKIAAKHGGTVTRFPAGFVFEGCTRRGSTQAAKPAEKAPTLRVIDGGAA